MKYATISTVHHGLFRVAFKHYIDVGIIKEHMLAVLWKSGSFTELGVHNILLFDDTGTRLLFNPRHAFVESVMMCALVVQDL